MGGGRRGVRRDHTGDCGPDVGPDAAALAQINQVVSREEILERVWGYRFSTSSRTIDNFIVRLRRYFETDPKNPQFIHSVRGVGYRFTSPD